MTKINKLGKSTFVIAILSFILVAVLSFGGTYAYFSAVSGRAAGTIKTAHLSLVATGDVISQLDTMTVANNTITQPGQRLVGDTTPGQDGNGANLSVKVTTNIDYYIRVKFEVIVKPGKYSWTDAEGGKYVWTEANDKTHNGVLTPDDKLTTETNEETRDEQVGQGDNVHDNISILDIALKVRDGAVTGTDPSENGTAWEEYVWKKTAGDTAYQHTGYFYPEIGNARKSYENSANPGVPFDYEYQMDVLINVQDWVGAHGCTYYMDAGIEIRFQVEILQADYLDATVLNNFIDVGEDGTKGEGCFFTGTLAGSDNPVPATIRELHYGWNAAIAYDQVQGGFKDPANPST